MSNHTFSESMLRLAAAAGGEVTFRYAKGDGKIIEQRNLFPRELRAAGNHTIVVGDDPDREAVRAYRIDRIKGKVRHV